MIIKIAVFVLLVFSGGAFATTLTLDQAVDQAVKNNPSLSASKAAWKSAEAKIPQVLALDDPQIGLEYEQIPAGSRNLEDGMKMYKAEQMIMFPGKIYAEWQMANKEAEVLGATYKAKILEITSQVKASYYDLFYADRAIETMVETKDLLFRVKKSAEAKYVAGATVQADVLLANIEFLMMDNELKTMEQEKEIKTAKLLAFLDLSGDASIETEPSLNLSENIEPQTAVAKAALNNRPELLAMKADLDVKDAAHLRSKMDYFPDTKLEVKKRVSDGWDAMFLFSFPLYFWKQSYGVSSVGLEREAAEAAYNNMKNLTIWMAKESWVMADAARRTKQLYEEKIVPQSTQALRVALTAYQLGKVDFQTLLNIERTNKEAKLKLYASQVNYGKALAELEKITGGELK